MFEKKFQRREDENPAVNSVMIKYSLIYGHGGGGWHELHVKKSLKRFERGRATYVRRSVCCAFRIKLSPESIYIIVCLGVQNPTSLYIYMSLCN